jgi:hypothetical protein
MKKISKKQAAVKRTRARSIAAKKGWETRRHNQREALVKQIAKDAKRTVHKSPKRDANADRPAGKAPIRVKGQGTRHHKKTGRAKKGTARPRKSREERLANENKKLRKALLAQERRDRTAIRKAQKETKKAVAEVKQSKTYEESLIKNMIAGGASNMAIVKLWPEKEHDRIKKMVIQAKLDIGVELYNDIRFDAFELAEDFDWDISDIYDAWDYDAEGST